MISFTLKRVVFLFFYFSYGLYVFAEKKQDKYSINFLFSGKSYSQSKIMTPPDFLFWRASTKVNSGGAFSLERILTEVNERILINKGLSLSHWMSSHTASISKHGISILSVYLSGYFYFLNIFSQQLYLYTSIGGPSWMSKNSFEKTGFSNRFVFQNQLGVGTNWGGRKEYNLGLRFIHYSNGDLFPINGGFDVPVAIFLGLNI